MFKELTTATPLCQGAGLSRGGDGHLDTPALARRRKETRLPPVQPDRRPRRLGRIMCPGCAGAGRQWGGAPPGRRRCRHSRSRRCRLPPALRASAWKHHAGGRHLRQRAMRHATQGGTQRENLDVRSPDRIYHELELRGRAAPVAGIVADVVGDEHEPRASAKHVCDVA